MAGCESSSSVFCIRIGLLNVDAGFITVNMDGVCSVLGTVSGDVGVDLLEND